ncbi:MAG: hypothetical protein ABI874_06520 [Chloroflexota bacterium]
MSEPDLSIIIAASDASHAIADCLRALEPQVAARDVELCVVASDAADARIVREQFPRVTLIASEPSRLIPELWGLGVARAQGRIIALTVATCVPDAQWVAEILRAHGEYHTAIGGAIENAPGGSLVDWAVYFVRYTPYMQPLTVGPLEVPGDNGTYKRAAIADQMEWIAQHGFWEREVNERLRAQMRSLWGDPRIVVYCQKPFTFGGFTRQRFAHGVIFGRMRAAKLTRRQRLIRIATAPAIPLVFLARITRNVFRKKRNRAQFIISLPLTIWFLLCWATGEFVGLVRG